MLQYQQATLTGVPTATRLSQLLRGQLGTEGAMRNPVATGARAVVLDANTLTPLDTILDSRTPRADPALRPERSSPVSDASYVETTIQGEPVGLRPFSVSQIAGRSRSGYRRRNGHLGSVARASPATVGTRPSVPLNEEIEVYDLEVLDGTGAVVRDGGGGCTGPSWVYTSAMQVADFGGVLGAYAVEGVSAVGVVWAGAGGERNGEFVRVVLRPYRPIFVEAGE